MIITALAYMVAGLMAPGAFGQFQYQQLKSFGFPELSSAAYTVSGLIEGSDGRLYGPSEGGIATRSHPFGAGLVVKLNKDGSGYTVLHSFSGIGEDGAFPSPLAEGSDGALYGTTVLGGSSDDGTVFKLNKDGSGYRVLHSFTFNDGATPQAALVEGSDGALYGTTWGGGNDGNFLCNGGTVFKLNKDGSGYTVIHNFTTCMAGYGSHPNTALVEGKDGKLYGLTMSGGIANGIDPYYSYGTVFELNKDGSGYAVLHSFTQQEEGWAASVETLVDGGDGALYGTTCYGGENNAGTVFKLNKDGSNYIVLHNFICYGGGICSPRAPLVKGSDGTLNGTTLEGGTNQAGTVFKINTNGSGYTILHHFMGGVDGISPLGLVEGNDGTFYGTTAYGGTNNAGTLFKLNMDGSGYAVLQNFSHLRDAYNPDVALLEGSDGALYGRTGRGSTNDAGTVFKLNKDGSGYTVLHAFASTEWAGFYPGAALIEGNDGALYGTTASGGTNYAGTIFKLNTDGSDYTVLRSFTGRDGDGRSPSAALLQASDGALYGSTSFGGITNASYPQGLGTVFKLNKDGTGYAVIRSFTSTDGEGRFPNAALVEGRDGALYGTTYDESAFYGTVFKLNRDGSGYMVLRSFTGGDDGTLLAGLVAGSDGALYGTTADGGTNKAGTVFKLNKDSTGFTVLHSFSHTDGPDGIAGPSAGLVEGSDGAMYGMARGNPAFSGSGRWLFKLNKDGSGYTVTHYFDNYSGEGMDPREALVQGSDGALYGTTSGGGDLGLGTVFVLRPQPVMLPPSVSGDAVTVRVSSMPGSTHRLQRAGTLSGNWLTLTNVVVPTNGVTEFTDPAPPLPSAFYRTVAP